MKSGRLSLPRSRWLRRLELALLLALSATLLPVATAGAADAAGAAGATPKAPQKSSHESDERAIRAGAAAFADAFHRGDARAIAAMWTQAGTLADAQGRIFTGRQAIEDQYAALLKQLPGGADGDRDPVDRLPRAEHGGRGWHSRVIAKTGADPVASRYTVVHAFENGKWLMAAVRETTIDLPSNYAALRDFEWLVGDWNVKAGETTVENHIRWIANKSFLEREYTVHVSGLTTSSGLQVIGWDPQAAQIRSWSFDSAGGHGTGLWTAAADGWRIEARGVLPDGTPTSAVNRLIRVPDDPNVFGWKSTDRKVGDQELPDMAEVVLDRVQDKKPSAAAPPRKSEPK